MTSWNDIDVLLSEIESRGLLREKSQPDGRSGRREGRRSRESPRDYTSAQEDYTRQQLSDQVTGHSASPAVVGGTAAAREAGASVTVERLETHPRSTHKLPRYNGEIAADTYLLQVQLAAQLNAWTAAETARHVALSLEGNALQILTDLRPDELQDWVVLKTAIQHRFGRRLYADDARDQLAKRQRGIGESLGAYAADLRTYARRGHPNFSEEVQEELAVQAFIRGLQPERLREHLRLHVPDTLAAALAEAERVEHVLYPEGWARNANPRVNQATGEESDVGEAVCRFITPVQQRQRKKPTACYRCGAPGHIARNCPAPTPKNQSPVGPLN